jgi:hypothetical protein
MVVCNLLLQADCEGPYPHLLRRLRRHFDIGDPYPTRLCHIELLLQPVGYDDRSLAATVSRSPAIFGLGAYGGLTHQPINTVMPPKSPPARAGRHAPCVAVQGTAFQPGLLAMPEKALVFGAAFGIPTRMGYLR